MLLVLVLGVRVRVHVRVRVRVRFRVVVTVDVVVSQVLLLVFTSGPGMQGGPASPINTLLLSGCIFYLCIGTIVEETVWLLFLLYVISICEVKNYTIVVLLKRCQDETF